MNIYRLPPDRYQLLPDLPRPEQSVVMVAEDAGRIVGHVGAERCWVVSPFEVEKPYRGSGLAEQLVQALAAQNAEGLTECLITTNPFVDLMVYRMGFKPLLGQLWKR
jgi:predicted N-acetyltransferase YhbS